MTHSPAETLDSPLSMTRLQQWVDHYQSERRALRSEVCMCCVLCLIVYGRPNATHDLHTPSACPPPHTHTHTHNIMYTHTQTHTHIHAHTYTHSQNQELRTSQAMALQSVAELQGLVGELEGQLVEEGEVHRSSIYHKEEEISHLTTQVHMGNTYVH